MNPFPPYTTAQTHWFQGLPPNFPPSSSFWETNNVGERLMDLQETLSLAKAMKKELEMLMVVEKKSSDDSVDKMCDDPTGSGFYEYMRARKLNLEFQRPLSIKSANALMLKLRTQLDPFMVVSDDFYPWEDKSAPARLSNKIQKSKRNKLWRKRKRKHTYRMLAEENKKFDQADQEANDWRAREIAKDIANHKVEKMKEIAKRKAKEEKKILEKELELVVIVEKLQELRSIRIQKLKKQGHFFPEEDDKFLKKVEAAVEEEERQAKEAAMESTGSGKAPPNEESLKDAKSDKNEITEKRVETHSKESEKSSDAQSGRNVVEEQGSKPYDTLTNLPIEFYHYYHGSSTDMGTLIEVRRTWDAYVRPGGRFGANLVYVRLLSTVRMYSSIAKMCSSTTAKKRQRSMFCLARGGDASPSINDDASVSD